MTIKSFKKKSNRVIRFIKNQMLDIYYLGVPVCFSEKTKYSTLGAHDIGYTGYRVIKYIFNNSYTIVPNDVLVDVGCAKGRILGYWLKHFKDNKIIGIELDEPAAQKAQKLFSKNKNVTVIHGNIIDSDIEDATVFYLFNSFNREVIKQFKQKLLKNYYGVNDITVIYYNCTFIDEFKEDPTWYVEDIAFPKNVTNHQAAIIKFRR